MVQERRSSSLYTESSATSGSGELSRTSSISMSTIIRCLLELSTNFPEVSQHLEKVLLYCAFNKEKALVGACSGHCESTIDSSNGCPLVAARWGGRTAWCPP